MAEFLPFLRVFCGYISYFWFFCTCWATIRRLIKGKKMLSYEYWWIRIHYKLKLLLDVMLPLEMKNISIQILKTGRTKLNTGTHNKILLVFMLPAFILFKWSYEVKLKLRTWLEKLLGKKKKKKKKGQLWFEWHLPNQSIQNFTVGYLWITSTWFRTE